MRRRFSGLLLVVSFLGAAAWPKDQKEQREPVFMAPEFRFSQIDTICLAPPIDLRSDKTKAIKCSCCLTASTSRIAHHTKSLQ